MGSVEDAARRELAALPEPARSSVLAAAVIVLAQRLDDSPGDAVASMLVRELRQAVAHLHLRQPEELRGEVERFLGRIAAPDGGDAAD